MKRLVGELVIFVVTAVHEIKGMIFSVLLFSLVYDNSDFLVRDDLEAAN